MKYGLDGGIFEHPAEGNERLCGNGERIDDRRTVACGELQQIDTIDETMEARSLGIDRDLPAGCDLAQLPGGRVRTIDEDRFVRTHAEHWRHCACHDKPIHD